jgi:hypothetical protein
MEELKKIGLGGTYVYSTHGRTERYVRIHKYLVGKHERETLLGRPGLIVEDDFKRSSKEI